VTLGTLRPVARVPRSSRSQPSRGRPQRPPVAARSERKSPSRRGLSARSPGCRADIGAFLLCGIAEPDLVLSPDGA
jgi:hypothetical protein